MQYFVVPTDPAAQLPDPDRGGLIPAAGIALNQSPRLATMIARGEVTATLIGAGPVTPPAPAIDPTSDRLSLRNASVDHLVDLLAFERYLVGAGRPVAQAIAAALGVAVADLPTKLEQLRSALFSHQIDTTNPHGVTAAQVGLGKVSNLAPLELPVSTAQSAAIANAIAGIVPLNPAAVGFQAAMAALWAAFEGALPQSDAGLPVGAWWSNGGIPVRVKVIS